MLNNIELERLKQRVRETLESGRVIVIVGWLAKKNDNEFVKRIKRLKVKKVAFYDASPPSLPAKSGYILSTKYVDHALFDWVRGKRKKIRSTVIEVSQIQAVLESCKDLLFLPPSCPVANNTKDETTESIITSTPTAEIPDDVLDFLTTPRNNAMNSMDCFAKAFLEAAEANGKKPGFVGKMTLGEIREKCGVEESNTLLANAGWIVGEVSDGKSHVGWYKAGPKMLAKSTQEKLEPDDPYELAKYLVAQKDGVLARKTEIDKILARIETAEKVLAQLAGLKEEK